MSQKQHRGAQRRAEKRHRREVERRQARAATRRPNDGPGEPPGPSGADDSVPSADEETVVHPYLTQRRRERDLGVSRNLHRWRREMPGFWTHAEVAALADDALFAGLADRGLVVGPADVLAHIARMPAGGSAWRMSRIYWLPMIAQRPVSAPDRDFLGLAAVELWRRLRPDDPPIESLLALVADAEDRRIADDLRGHVEGLIRFLAAARARIDPHRPDELGGVQLSLSHYCTRMALAAARVVRQCPDLAAEALAEAERWLEAVVAGKNDVDRRFIEEVLAHLCNELGRHEDAEQRLRAAVARDPGNSLARRALAEQLHQHHRGDRDRLVEALELWESTRPAADEPGMDLFQETRDAIVESLRLHDAGAAGAPA